MHVNDDDPGAAFDMQSSPNSDSTLTASEGECEMSVARSASIMQFSPHSDATTLTASEGEQECEVRGPRKDV